jgi:2-keto-3-deoxy-L-rhamnonate aldolase RhmA
MFDPTRASLRSRLAQKAPLGAFWMSLGSATVVEIAAGAKPDAIVIDAQHGLFDRQTLEHAVGAARPARRCAGSHRREYRDGDQPSAR